MKKLFFLITLSVFYSLQMHAQTATVTNGGTATGNGGTIDFSVGQISTQLTSDASTSISIAEGVQQPFEISVVGVDELLSLLLDATLFPNPTLHFTQLQIDNFDLVHNKVEALLFDIEGKLLLTVKILNPQTQIQMGELPPSTYFLRVQSDDRILKTFKVVKQ